MIVEYSPKQICMIIRVLDNVRGDMQRLMSIRSGLLEETGEHVECLISLVKGRRRNTVSDR